MGPGGVHGVPISAADLDVTVSGAEEVALGAAFADEHSAALQRVDRQAASLATTLTRGTSEDDDEEDEDGDGGDGMSGGSDDSGAGAFFDLPFAADDD